MRVNMALCSPSFIFPYPPCHMDIPVWDWGPRQLVTNIYMLPSAGGIIHEETRAHSSSPCSTAGWKLVTAEPADAQMYLTPQGSSDTTSWRAGEERATGLEIRLLRL